MKVVIDANVFVSAALTPYGVAGQIIQAWERGRFEVLSCGALVSEVADVLARPRIISEVGAERRTRFIAFLVHWARMVPDPPPVAGLSPNDPDDDYLLTLAREQGAALVTGDRHLLDLPGMPAIMSPRQFLTLLP